MVVVCKDGAVVEVQGDGERAGYGSCSSTASSKRVKLARVV